MREIKGRGKRKDNYEWVYGGILHQTDWYGHPVDKWFIIDGTDTEDYNIGRAYEVFEDTVGQFIGELDKNLKEIHEGDIVKTNEGNWKGEVIFRNGMFMVVDNSGGYSCHCDWDEFEVIGNLEDGLLCK